MDEKDRIKLLSKLQSNIEVILSDLPHNANKKQKVSAICRKLRLNRNDARKFL